MNSTGYSIQVDDNQSIIHVTATGEMDSEFVSKLASEAGRAAGDHGFDRLLFDLRDASVNISILDNYELAKHPERTGMCRHYRRAIVHSKDMSTTRFFETVSHNSGYIVETFLDVDNALSWLLAD